MLHFIACASYNSAVTHMQQSTRPCTKSQYSLLSYVNYSDSCSTQLHNGLCSSIVSFTRWTLKFLLCPQRLKGKRRFMSHLL